MRKKINQPLSWKYKLLLIYNEFQSNFLIVLYLLLLVLNFVEIQKFYKTKNSSRNLHTNAPILDFNIKTPNGSAYDYLTNKAQKEEININHNYIEIDKSTRKNNPPLHLFFLFITLIIIIYIRIKKEIKNYKFIKNGVLTIGKIVDKQALENNNTYPKTYNVKVSYNSFVNKNYNLSIIEDTLTYSKSEIETEVLIIYNKKEPEQAILVDNLSKSIAKYIKKNWIS